MQEADTDDHQGTLGFEEFCAFYKMMSTRRDLYLLMLTYSDHKDHLGAADLQRFLEVEQKVMRPLAPGAVASWPWPRAWGRGGPAIQGPQRGAHTAEPQPHSAEPWWEPGLGPWPQRRRALAAWAHALSPSPA